TDEQRSVGGERKVLVRASDHLVVEQGSQTRVGTVLVQHAGRQVQVSADGEVVVEGGASISLKVGGQHLVINSAGIFASSPIQVGGTPAASVMAQPLLPGDSQAQPAPLLPTTVGPVQLELVTASEAFRSVVCPVCDSCCEALSLGGAV
ncbi:type VI secretion system tip protein VgrG, partial [Pseudomonas sichuanensis]